MNHRLIIAVALAPLIVAASPATVVGMAPREIAGPIEARVIKVRDGDTIEVAAYVWPQQTIEIAVRMRGIDAPELRAKCDVEREAAIAARDRLSELVVEGTVRLHSVAGDKYFGRVLANVSTETHADLAATLVSEGLVDAYDGGRRRDWCTTLGAQFRTGARPAAAWIERGVGVVTADIP